MDSEQKMLTGVIKRLDETLNDGKTGTDRGVGVAIVVFPLHGSSRTRTDFLSNGVSMIDVVGVMENKLASTASVH